MLHSGRVGSLRTSAIVVLDVHRCPVLSTVVALTTAPSPAPSMAIRGRASSSPSRGVAEIEGGDAELPHPAHASPTAKERTTTLRTKAFSTRGAAASTAPDRRRAPSREPFAHPGERAAGRLGDVAQLLRLGQRLQLLERLVLDLADALARDVERPPDLVERARVLAAEAVAQLEHAALAVGEVLQRLAQRLLGEDLRSALVGRLGPLVGDELAELGLLLVADRLLERDRRLGRALDRVDLLGIDARDLGDLVGRGLAPELGDELALGAADLVELLDHVHGDADRARLVRQGAGDRLADPPGRVGRELEALAVVELLRRADETEGALLDEVQERQALVAVVLGDRDDQAQVRLDHLLLGVEVAALDALGEIDLLLRREQTDLPDVLQEELKGVGGHVRAQVQRGLRLAPTALVGRALDLLGGSGGRVDLLDELDLRLLEEAVQLLDVGLVEIQLGDRVSDLGEREDAHLLASGHEALDLFKFLEFNY